ncbi:MAG: prephenate dehydrogenase/arogenate dehydrogenase family protein [Chloroflexi bacterium]|nr:prephenate dehydrogenase/arogenate dehydrogenase family protein [Dehalococcoidia bacterium]MCO5203163.1 prephenate dehydrogenase/arogenate dehydrogenase family protein [Chloroflexota bacterium]NJD66037.1 prephenate dehydrogenase/arogenate dehydrogenase family protein [Chloroflexota bacterium]PWB42646.1 MAG: prephenate dehydrogenase/arogenate dehydrogenase family protein [Dehalococcoidia bacterium]
MPQSRVSIIGTGLIGTSIGLALASRPDRQYEIVGADRDRTAARTAKKMGALDREVGSLEEAVQGAGLVILAVPVVAARQILQDIGRYLEPGVVITDACSTKSDIMRWAQEYLPESANFVGGHPMAGKEKSGPSAASADLFKDATWAITPSPRADEKAVGVVLGLVETLGAIPLYIDSAEHDQYAAAVSHVPLLLSVALFRMVRDSQGWEDASLLAGPGFRDLTRLASGDPVMSRDIMFTNREAILHWIGRIQDELSTVKKALEIGGEPVLDLFRSTQLDRDTFIENPPVRRRPEGVGAPSAQDAMARMFVGGLYDRLKEVSSRGPGAPKDDAELRRKLGVRDNP